MAQYDYTGYESAFVNSPMGGYGMDPYLELEEERRRREEEERRRQEEAASQVVQSQQVQTRADGSQTVTTKTERPGRSMAFGNVAGPVEPSVPGAPRLPGVPGMQTDAASDESDRRRRAMVAAALGVPTEIANAGSPVDLFSRIVSAESGGQHTDAQGKILTSPKGAQGIAQIMPQTAAAPGFGIRPASPQEIATPEGNLAFGGRYLQGMLNLFGGDQVKATAAYNAGPGRVKQAEQLAAQRGGSFMDYLPRETINYVGKIFGSMIPSAQAGTLPQPPAGAGRGTMGMPQAQPGPGVAVATGQGVRGTMETPLQPVAPTELPPREPVVEVQAGGEQDPTVVQQPMTPGPVAPTAVAPSSISAAPDTVTAQGQPAPNSFDPFGTPIYSPEQEQLDRQIQAYNSAQGNVDGLLSVANDPNARDWIKSQAKSDLADLLVQEREKKKAESQLTKMTPQEISREITRPSKDEGSWLKYMLFAALRIEPLMQAEGIKLGIYDKTQYIKDENGNSYQVRMAGDGTIKSGIDAKTGQPMTEEQLIKAGGMVSALGQQKAHLMPQTLGSPVTKTIDGKLVNGIQMYDPVRKEMYVQYGNQRDYNPSGWTSATQNIDVQRAQQLQKANIDLQTAWAKGQQEVRQKGPEAYNTWLGQFQAQFPNVPVTYQSLQGNAPQFDVTTGQLVSGAAPAIAQQAAPQQAAAQQAAPQVTAQPAGAVAPGATAAAPVTTGPVQPGDVISQRETTKKQRETDLAVEETRRKEAAKANQTFTDNLNKTRNSGVAQKATIDRLQSAIAANPDFWGIDTNSAAWRAFVDVNSTNADRQTALDTFARNLNIPKERRAAFDQVMNDYRNLQVNAVTSSGLSASQTNTERESQRVVSTIGSISDRPAAARATLEYAKAKIEYTEAKARAWADLRKTNPDADYSIFEIDFDRNQGEKIFENANERMNRIINRPPISATQGAAGAAQSAAPAMTPADRARQELERRRRERGGQ